MQAFDDPNEMSIVPAAYPQGDTKATVLSKEGGAGLWSGKASGQDVRWNQVRFTVVQPLRRLGFRLGPRITPSSGLSATFSLCQGEKGLEEDMSGRHDSRQTLRIIHSRASSATIRNISQPRSHRVRSCSSTTTG